MNPIWLHGEGTMGILESTPHNHVHGNIGGNMVRTPTAALDPIFLMHHANVDRIWAAWNFKGGVNSAEFIWNNMPFTNNFWTGESTSRADPWSPKVNELYSPTTLGYSYDNVTTDRRLPAPPAMVALESRIRGLFSMTAPIGRTAGALSTFAVASAGSQVGTAKKPLDISVTVDSGRLAAVVRSNAAKVHDALLDFMNPQIRIDAPQTAPGPKVFALIRGVMLTNTENTHFHVFIDANGITDQTSTTDPHFVGSFALFDHGNHTGPDNGASLIVDLTDTVHALYGSGHPTGARMRVQIVPVANRPAESAPGTVMVDRIEVVFV
jgi:tyrosinase